MSPQALAEAGPQTNHRNAPLVHAGTHPAVLGLASALLLWFAFPPADWGWLAWVALAPLFMLIPSQRSWSSIYFGAWLGGMTFWLLAIQWVRLSDSEAWLAWMVMAFVLSLWWPGFIVLARTAVLRFRIPTMVAAPVVWVGLEYLRAHILSGFPWYYLAHSQHAYLPVIQAADLVGALGLSFLIALFNAWCVDIRTMPLFQSAEPRRLTRPQLTRTLTLAAFLAATLAYGGFRLATATFHDGPKIALLQSNLDQKRKMGPKPEVLLAMYERLVRRALLRGRPDLIVWPETSYPYFPYVLRDPQLDTDAFESLVKSFDPDHKGEFWRDWERTRAEHLHRWTDAVGVPMLVGVLTYEFERTRFAKYNCALLFQPGVSTQQRYAKMHLVPFGEYIPLIEMFPWLTILTPYRNGYIPSLAFGRDATCFNLGSYRLATAICFEDTIPQAVRRFFQDANQGQEPDVLINISNDGWFHGSSELDTHLAISVFRAVENRVPLVRAVNTGLSALIDGNGKVLQSLPKLTEDVLSVTVPLDDRSSVYSVFGDWLGMLCLAAAGTLIPLRLARGIIARRPIQPNSTNSPDLPGASS